MIDLYELRLSYDKSYSNKNSKPNKSVANHWLFLNNNLD